MRIALMRCIWIFLVAMALPAGATDRTWPGAAPCATTLQACLDGAVDGDRVLIATNATIGEDISLYNRSLTLTAADGYTPTFGNAHWLSITSAPIAGDQTVSVSRLRFVDGYVYVNYNGTGTGTYDLRELSLTHTAIDSANFIEVNANGTTNATLYNNRISGIPRDLNNGLINLVAAGHALTATVYYNHLTSTSSTLASGAGLFVNARASGAVGAGGTSYIHGNEIRGGFSRGGIVVSEGLFSPTASSISTRVYNNVIVGLSNNSDGSGGSGIAFIVNSGSIDAQAVNNTVSRSYSGVQALLWEGGGGTATISGVVKNNVLLANYGLRYAGGTTTATLASNSDYNLLNAATPYQGVVAGVHDITSDARVVVDSQPRLRSDSPAIDAADSTTLGFGLIFNGLPTTDADGLRRFVGTGNKADIGAFEFGNAHLLQTSTTANTSAHVTDVDSPATNGQTAADVFTTPSYNAGVVGSGVNDDHPTGVYYHGTQWAIFNQDFAAILGEHFNVWSPSSGAGLFRHTATAANITGNETTLNDSSVNSLPDRVVEVSQNWSVAGVYNAQQIGVRYDAGTATWSIRNGSSVAMPTSAGFNVYAQQPSPNAFVLTANALNTSAGDLMIDHPLLNGASCALIQVTREYTGSDFPHAFNVAYGIDNRWHITDYSHALPLGARFHVIVDPAQVFACSDRIFADGFQ